MDNNAEELLEQKIWEYIEQCDKTRYLEIVEFILGYDNELVVEYKTALGLPF